MKRIMTFTDDFILLEDGTLAEIASSISKVAEQIDEFCDTKVQTRVFGLDDQLNVRFEFGYNRFIEFEADGIHSNLFINGKKFFALRLKRISNTGTKCLVARIMNEVFSCNPTIM